MPFLGPSFSGQFRIVGREALVSRKCDTRGKIATAGQWMERTCAAPRARSGTVSYRGGVWAQVRSRPKMARGNPCGCAGPGSGAAPARLGSGNVSPKARNLDKPAEAAS
jgi:hypothetical protein